MKPEATETKCRWTLEGKQRTQPGEKLASGHNKSNDKPKVARVAKLC